MSSAKFQDSICYPLEGSTVHRTDLDTALAAFDPENFGFIPFQSGWVKETARFGSIVICTLDWEHAQAASYDYDGVDRREMDALNLMVRLQDRTWGMPPEDLVPVNLLAVLGDTGGANVVAYQLDKGFNSDGWLGFVIGAGSATGTLVSHMLGVHETIRGVRDIGWYLKIVQAYLALQNGHHCMSWTFDPMRGANARLNLEKLGARIDELAINKYGVLRSVLYGDVPSDRFLAKWDLLSTRTHERIDAVYHRRHPDHSAEDLLDVPELNVESALELAIQQPARLRYRIPGDIDHLMRQDPHAAIHWREEMRQALTGFLTTKIGVAGDVEQYGPVAIHIETHPGPYSIASFATGHNEVDERVSYYVLERRD